LIEIRDSLSLAATTIRGLKGGTMDKTNFAKVLKELMDEDGKNQLDLAQELGIRQSQVSNWINGKSLPGYHSIRTLCNYFKVSADMLLETEYGD